MKERVLVAMSGGVDSSVAALLMKQQGFDVAGVTLLLQGDAPDPQLPVLCDKLQIPLTVTDCRQSFRERVLIPAAKEYDRGRTPNPCCECNEVLKFRELFQVAEELHCRRVVTGHYVRLCTSERGVLLRRGIDPRKDQSYFLYRLPRAWLERICFPLGEMTKLEVRRLAAEHELPCASRPDSQDACFQIPGECCGETLRRLADLPPRPGKFIWQGKCVGRHDGIHRFTLGQRNGHGVALGVPAYIRAICAETGEVELTTAPEQLLSREFSLIRTNMQTPALPLEGQAEIRVRYRSPAVPCRYVSSGNGVFRVTLEEPLRAVTPGQAGVFYRGDVLLGGGVIDGVMPCC